MSNFAKKISQEHDNVDTNYIKTIEQAEILIQTNDPALIQNETFGGITLLVVIPNISLSSTFTSSFIENIEQFCYEENNPNQAISEQLRKIYIPVAMS